MTNVTGMRALFWCSTILVVYVYVGYPLLLRLWARLRPRPFRLQTSNFRLQPRVSIVIAARNEGARLAARMDNLLSLDYPAGKRQIVVVSDGSTDDTLEVLARYAGCVDVVAIPTGGKAVALNAGVARATGDVLVFTDARQMFEANALRELVAPLANPSIGAVTGELLLDAESPGLAAQSTIAEGVGLYWKYEKQIRRSESAIDSTLGATGAIYAMRRSLFRPLPPDTLLDDVLAPMRVVLAGYRVVFNERARAFDRAAVDADAEARRKVRTIAGNYQILALEPRLLLPIRNRVWLQYVSHKIGRLVVPYAMLAMFVASIALAAAHPFYLAVLAGYVALMLLAACGAVIEYRSQIADGRLEAPRPVAPPVGRIA